MINTKVFISTTMITLFVGHQLLPKFAPGIYNGIFSNLPRLAESNEKNSGLWLFILICLLLPIFAIVQEVLNRKRREALSAWATTQGLQYQKGKRWNFAKDYHFKLLRQGTHRYAYNIMDGDFDGRYVQAFDYHYQKTTKSRNGKRNTKHYYFSGVLFEASIPLNPLAIRPENLFDKTTTFFGYDDINFESAAFSRAFHVSAEDRKWAYDILHNRAIEWLMKNPKYHIEFGGNHVLIGRGGKTLKPEEFEQALTTADGLLDMIPDYVKQKQRNLTDETEHTKD